MRLRKASLIAASIFAIAALSPANAGNVTIDEIVNDHKSPGDILTNGQDIRGQRYSTLDKINTSNVNALVPAWVFSYGGEKQKGQEAQAIIKDGVIYVTASYSRMFAIDAKTGEEKWQYDARLPEGILPCCDVINRGAAIYGDKIYFGTLDAQLVALNRETGKVAWRQKLGDYKEGFSYTAAPLIVPSKHGPLVVTGVSGGEFGIVGRVDARNAETGELVWSRPTIEGHYGTLKGKKSTMTGKKNESWPGDMWKWGGGATWLGGTYDPDTKQIFMGTGNPAPWNSHLRPGDNKWSCGRLAINPDTGEINWGFQTTPHDGWDYDGVNEVIAFDAGGKKLAATADRNGFFYVLDRTTGKFVNGFAFVDEITWAKGLKKDGSPVFNKDNYPGDPKKAKKGKSVFVVPSFLGGKNQMPMAYSQQTGLFYVPSNEWGMDLWNQPVTYKKGAAYLGAGFTIKPIKKTHIGSLKAIDPMTGEVKWEQTNKAPLWGGVLATASGLVFYGNPEGYLMARDAKTGKELWKFQVGSGVVAPPVTWEQDGEQMIGVSVGWGGAVPLWGGEVAKTVKRFNQGGSYWVFKLPKKMAAK